MLDKDLYDLWKNRMELYMQNKEHGRMILESVENDPLIWPTVEENGVTRTKKYVELSAAEKIQADCDMKATNIILQGLPADIYSLVNHHRVAKDLWERVQLLMQGTSLTKQERECKLYDAFDKFTHIKGESLHKYYLRFTQLINDMNIYNMKMEQFQVNTKFLNSLPPEWSKFVTDVKLVKDLHTTNFDQLHAYLEQHELHANEVRLMRERNQDPLALVANHQMTPPHFNTYQSSYNNPQLQQQFPPSQYGSIHPTQHYSSTYPSQPQFNHSSVPPSYPYQSQMNHQTSSVPQIAYQSPQVSTQPMTESPLVDSGLAVPVFSPGDDPIACLNKAMAFLTAVASSRFPSTNNQLRTSSNPRNQATIQDGRVTVQQVQGRQGQSYSGTGYKSNATSSGGNNASGQARVVKCYNCQGEGHMARQCTQPKRPRNAQIRGQAVQTIIPHNAAFQNEDLNTYDSDCDDVSNAKAVLMANISNYGSNVLSVVPHSETYLNDMENQSVHVMQDFEQTHVVDSTDTEITSDNNIIPYSQYLQETQQANVQDTNLQAQQNSMILSMIEQMLEQMINHVNNWEKANKEQNNESVTAELERYKERVKTFEQRLNIDLSCREKMIDSQMDDMIKEKLALKEQVDSLKQNLSKQIKEKECLLQTFTVFKNESKEKENKDMENKIDLEKKIKGLDNIIFKVELSAEQAFWLRMYNTTSKSSDASPVIIEAPKELPNVSVVNEGLKNLKFHRARFDNVVKIWTTPDARSEGEWGLQLTNNDLKAQLQEKDTNILKGKEIVDIAAQIPSANTIVPGMFKLDLEPLALRLLQNREAYIDYLKYTQEQADILRGIVEQAKAKQPSDNTLNFACKHAQRIQELLVYVRDTCSNANKLSAKKVVVTLKNNVKKVRFVEPLTSSSNIKQVESSTTSDSNTPMLSPTGLKCSTSNCGSKPIGNKKNDRILRTPSRNMKNKVEAQPRKVNKKNRVVEPIRDVDVKHSLLNANSEPTCATCKKSMFDGVHDMCLLDFVENVNNRAKFAKNHKNQNI
ncbi:retrovirus-related pol polyprotein from transposon TNT 1-94 [Tanacetum coccineum]